MLKDVLKERKMLIVIVICTGLVLLAINMGNNVNKNNSSDTGKGANYTEKTFNVAPNSDDENFTKWLTMSNLLISNDLGCIVTAAKNQNFTDTERCGKFLKEDSDRSLNDSNLHNNISVSLVPVFNQYKDALKNYNLGGEYLETGAKNQNATQMEMGSRYIDIANKGVIRTKHIYSSIGANDNFNSSI